MRVRTLALAAAVTAALSATGSAGGAPARDRGASQGPPYVIVDYFATYRPVIGKVAKRFDDRGRLKVVVGCRQVLGGLGSSCRGGLSATVKRRPAGTRAFVVSAGRDRAVRLKVRLSRKQRRRPAVRLELTATLNSDEVTKTVRVKRARRR